MTIDANDLQQRFQHHPPRNDADIKAHEAIRETCRQAAVTIMGQTPASREQSLAVTKLEEAMMWANAALARNRSDAD